MSSFLINKNKIRNKCKNNVQKNNKQMIKQELVNTPANFLGNRLPHT